MKNFRFRKLNKNAIREVAKYKENEKTLKNPESDSYYNILMKAEKSMRSKYFYDPEKPVIQLYKENLDKLRKANIKIEQILAALKTLRLKYDYVINYLFSEEEKDKLYKLLDKETKKKMKENKYCIKRVCLELKGVKLKYLETFTNCNNCCGYPENKCPVCKIQLSIGKIEIENMRTKKKIIFNNSLCHMIYKHNLFEKTYDERVDPNDLIEVLELKPNVNYREKRRKKNTLILEIASSNFDDESDEKISWESFYIFNTFRENNDMDRFRKKLKKIYLGDPKDGNYICYFKDFEEVYYGGLTINEGDEDYKKIIYLICNNSEKIINKIHEIKIPELEETYELYLENVHFAWRKKSILGMTMEEIFDIPV